MVWLPSGGSSGGGSSGVAGGCGVGLVVLEDQSHCKKCQVAIQMGWRNSHASSKASIGSLIRSLPKWSSIHNVKSDQGASRSAASDRKALASCFQCVCCARLCHCWPCCSSQRRRISCKAVSASSVGRPHASATASTSSSGSFWTCLLHHCSMLSSL
jgi:hypothetical protein